MTEKRLTVILFGSDRKVWRGGPLKIRVVDVFASRGPRILHQSQTKESTLELRLKLPFDAGQVYGLTFSAPDHRPAWQLIRRQDFIRVPENIEGDDLVLRLMLVPDSPGTTDVPRGFERLQQAASPFASLLGGVDAETFRALNVPAQMAFLNIEAKLRETFLDGAPLLSFVRRIRHVAVDRVFLFFDAALKARMPRATDFAAAPGHGAPKRLADLPAHPDSWKHTKFAEGNVQLSFSRDAAPLAGADPSLMVHSADVDVDLGRGLAHAREWLENNVFQPGHKTNQSLVYALLYAQRILPLYTLDPALAAAPMTRSVRVSRGSRSASRGAPRPPSRRSATPGIRTKTTKKRTTRRKKAKKRNTPRKPA